MAFCSKCGKEINDEAVVCIHCGCAVAPLNQAARPAAQDSGSFGWGLLGFCVPLVGLILFLAWKNDTPLKAKSAGIGALISVIASVLFWVVYVVILMIAFATLGV